MAVQHYTTELKAAKFGYQNKVTNFILVTILSILADRIILQSSNHLALAKEQDLD